MLSISSITIPVSPLGPENPLPPLRTLADPRGGLEATAADAEMAAQLAYGHAESLLPYTFQDGYGRERAERELKTAVLDNGILRAEFLLEYGGRLRSLVHHASGRELLHKPPHLQLANLGLRNAWFAGGVEWNLGTFGHTALACAPLHAARVIRPDGVPVLRMYEWERMRRLVYQIDACLPPGSPVLIVHVKVYNPFTEDTPVYWWSNAAVPQTPGTRVLAPAERAYHFSYDGRLRRVPVPRWQDADQSYPGRNEQAADFFYELPDGQRRWIAAVDEQGAGLAQVSTALLRGRKHFRWGTSPAGRNWQDWLSGPDRPYLELQGGLARTQLEHVRLAPRSSLSWTEVFGLVEVDGAHGDWPSATAAAGEAIERLIPAGRLEAEHETALAMAAAVPAEILHVGSGWGALERKALAKRRSRALNLPATPFGDATIGRDQQSWLSLVRKGAIPTPAPALPPSSYTVGPEWRALLEAAEPTWFTLFHLGVNLYHDGDREGARQAWERSLECAQNAWALRSLAVLESDPGLVADLYTRAHRLAPRLRPLTIEALGALLAAGRTGEALAVIDKLGPADRWHGRVRLLEARAALDGGDLVRAKRVLETGLVVDDLREGEDSLDALWWDYQEQLNPSGKVRVRDEQRLPCRYDYSVKQF
ncbi:DUF5107 domain-containing protein [Nonomuraea sp. NBC_01738]|uniref:DUF5107 domain-containing protein n=1 Tax=Nonomuraea sp. NBC_01738 TaxID=2976003 RepID=UPI002E0D1343|nr:DUF5107 domain-containing protein [Nonomuraea sp. NBC_01738]